MATIYRIHALTDQFQYFQITEGWKPADEEMFVGSPMADTWQPPRLYVGKPRLRKPDIWAFPQSGGAFVFGSKELPHLRHVLEPVAELLPVKFQRREMFVLNVTYVADCLDKKKSDFPKGRPHHITRHAFTLARIKHSIFKIPQTRMTHLYAVEGLFSPEEEFKALVEEHELQGLHFERLWSDDE